MIEINGLTLSDWLLVLSAIPAGWFFVEYVLLTKWWPDPLGWVTALFNVAVLGLLGLIVYAIFLGERVPEVWRFIFAAFLFTALSGKVVILHLERRRGRLEKTHRLHKENEMTAAIPTDQITKDTVPRIWYQAQRVLRTIVSTVLSALSVWAVFVIIWPDIMAELAKILPASWVAWLAAAVVAISAVAGAITKIIALPRVNAWLTKWLNLGSVPKQALVAQVVREPEGDVHVITAVAPDPKAVANQ